MLAAMMEDKLAVVNPLGAVLPQNKRTMAFMWEHLHRFSPGSQETIQQHVPVTSRLEVLHVEQLVAKDDWVLKSDWLRGRRGRAGAAARGRGLAARDRARARGALDRAALLRGGAGGGRVDNQPRRLPRWGGEAAGLYARVQLGPTDGRAISAPALVVR